MNKTKIYFLIISPSIQMRSVHFDLELLNGKDSSITLKERCYSCVAFNADIKETGALEEILEYQTVNYTLTDLYQNFLKNGKIQYNTEDISNLFNNHVKIFQDVGDRVFKKMNDYKTSKIDKIKTFATWFWDITSNGVTLLREDRTDKMFILTVDGCELKIELEYECLCKIIMALFRPDIYYFWCSDHITQFTSINDIERLYHTFIRLAIQKNMIVDNVKYKEIKDNHDLFVQKSFKIYEKLEREVSSRSSVMIRGFMDLFAYKFSAKEGVLEITNRDSSWYITLEEVEIEIEKRMEEAYKMIICLMRPDLYYLSFADPKTSFSSSKDIKKIASKIYKFFKTLE